MGLALTSYGIFWGSTTVSVAGTLNNWTPTGLSGAVVVYASGFSDATVTGLTGGEDGRLLFLVNYSSTILLNIEDQHAGSSAANRFALVTVGTTSLFPGDSIALIYDGPAQRWKQAMQYA